MLDPLLCSCLRSYSRLSDRIICYGMDCSNLCHRDGSGSRSRQLFHRALADLVSPDYNEAIKRTKDLAAGAVLILAIAAAIVGLLIFIPKFLN